MAEPEVYILLDVDPQVEGRIIESELQSALSAAVGVASSDTTRNPIIPYSDTESFQVSVLVTVDSKMQELNLAYRGIDKPTDVLSFSLLEGDNSPAPTPGQPVSLGDVVLNLPYAERQAEELGHAVDMELAWLLIHGSLQLLGYQHDDQAQAEHMEQLERQALGSLGFNAEN